MEYKVSEKLIDEINNFLAEYEKFHLLTDGKYKTARHDPTTAAVYFLLRKIEELQTRVDELEGNK